MKRIFSENMSLLLKAHERAGSHVAAHTPIVQAYSGRELVQAFLESVAHEIATEGFLPEVVLLSFPATWNAPEKQELVARFREAAAAAFGRVRSMHGFPRAVEVSLALSEPEALLLHQVVSRQGRVAAGSALANCSALAMVDVGGGTTDVAFVRPNVERVRSSVVRRLHPVRALAFDVAGEDITLAIASDLWRRVVSALGDKGSQSPAGPEVIRTAYPASPQLRAAPSVEGEALAWIDEVWRWATRLKEGESNQVNLVRGLKISPPFTAADATKAAEVPLERIASGVCDLVRRLATATTAPSGRSGSFLVLLGGNAVRYAPLRERLEHRLQQVAGVVEGPTLVETVEMDAKEGVSLGAVLHANWGLAGDALNDLPFRWGAPPGAALQEAWSLRLRLDAAAEVTLSTAPGARTVFRRLPARDHDGFQSIKVTAILHTDAGNVEFDCSPRADGPYFETWHPRGTPSSELRRANVELDGRDGFKVTVEGHDGSVMERRVSFAEVQRRRAS